MKSASRRMSFFLPGYLLAGFILIGSALSSFAQSGSWQFLNFTSEDGLSNNNVNTINQDSLEFIWIGTENGLSRFNGTDFKNYFRITGDSTSISGNSINKIYIDSKKRILVATSGGLCLYDPRHDNFKRIYEQRRIAVRDIVEDKYGNIWVATEGSGLVKLSGELKILNHYNTNDSLSLPSGNYIWTLFADQNVIWIGTLEGSLVKFDQISGTFELIEEYGRNNGYISYIGKDKYDNLIVFSNQTRLAKLIREKGQVKYKIHRYLTDNYFYYNIIKRPDGIFWLTHSTGILVFDPQKETFRNLKEDPDYSDLNLNFGSPVIFLDNHQNIWMASQNKGLAMIGNSFKPFFNHRDEVFQSSYVNFITRTLDNKFLTATNIGGIMTINENEGEFSMAQEFDVFNNFRITANTIYKILEIDKNKFLIGTYRGLIFFDLNTRHKEYYYLDDGRSNTLNNSHVYDMLQVDRNTVWLATNGGGINIFDIPSRRFTYITKKGNPLQGGLVDNYCISLLKDHSGKIWIGTYNGFSIYNPKDETFKSYLPDQNNPASLSHNWIYCFYEDSRNNMWIGTFNGLNLFDSKEGTFRIFDKTTGLSDNVINGLMEDDQNQLWISTGKGISKLLLDNFECESYRGDDGLKVLQFARKSIYKDKFGYIYMGGEGGIISFDPSRIKRNPYPPTVWITAIKIFNKKIDSQSNPEILPEEVTYLDKIKIPFRLNVITFEFTGLNYVNPNRNTYAYQLEGFDKNWQYIDNKHEVTYTNLDPGEYIFRVKAANNDGIWNHKGKKISVIIMPPWWNTFIFRLSVVLLLLGLVAGFYFYKINSLHRHREHLENLVKERTKEIEEKNAKLIQQTKSLNAINVLLEERQQYIENQAKKLQINSDNLRQANELLVERQTTVLKQADDLLKTNQKLTLLNATKDKFFSIIAHDLKNPFSSLLGFSELLYNDFKNLTEDKKRQISEVIHSSAEKIYKLLENLLQWAGTQIGNISYNPEVLDLKEIIESNQELVKEMMKEKDTSFFAELPEDSVVFADRNMVNTIIRNLIGNAVKFTEKGRISVIVKIVNHHQEVAISDSGVGIPEDKLINLFDIGQTSSTWGTRGEKGSGLGLMICKEFIERNGGEITVKSKPGQGTTFVFTLPRS